jgi:hypothetical protein
MFMLHLCTTLYCRWKQTSDNRKIIEKLMISGCPESSTCVLSEHVGKKGDQLYIQTKHLYTVHAQHPMRGMTGQDQDWKLLFQKDNVSLSSMLVGIDEPNYAKLTLISLFKSSCLYFQWVVSFWGGDRGFITNAHLIVRSGSNVEITTTTWTTPIIINGCRRS